MDLQHPDGTVRDDVPFAHPSLSLLIYRAAYVQTPPLERGRYDPMPLPLVALAATAVSSYLFTEVSLWAYSSLDLCRFK